MAPGMAMAHGQQVLEREMEPDAEHQQDDAELGELVGEVLVGDEAGGERPDGDAGDQVADQRRELEAVRHRAECPGERERNHNGGNQRGVMRHETWLFSVVSRQLLLQSGRR